MKKLCLLLIIFSFNVWSQPQDGKPPGPAQVDEQNKTGWEQGKLEELEVVAVQALNQQSKVCQGLDKQSPAPLVAANFYEAYNTLFLAHTWYSFNRSPKLDVVDCKSCEGNVLKIPQRKAASNPIADSLSPYLACLIKSDSSVGITIFIDDPEFGTYMKLKHPEIADETISRMKNFFHLYLGDGHGQ